MQLRSQAYLLRILKVSVALKAVIVDQLFNHHTFDSQQKQLCGPAEDWGWKKKKKKADQISFIGDVIAFILAITHLCLLRLELIAGKDKLLFLSLLHWGDTGSV